MGGGREEAEAPLVARLRGEAEAPSNKHDRDERGVGR
jgi:hypothetical protein